MKLIILITMLVALALPIKAEAKDADAWVRHWSVAKQIHTYKKRWIKNHPQHFTYRRWRRALRHHREAIHFASTQILRWQYRTTPPNLSSWLCIHGHEGSWADTGDPYWGGLQMDREFMTTYAPAHLLRRGWANRWTPNEQMWVAERARRAGRGFYPWPNTARFCHLI